MKRQSRPSILGNLRKRIETARLDLLALFRALDRVNLAPSEIPQSLLRELFELDADFAEGLWALDQPPESLNFRGGLSVALSALENWLEDCDEFLDCLPSRVLQPLVDQRELIRPTLTIQDAYLQVPGRDPNAGDPLNG